MKKIILNSVLSVRVRKTAVGSLPRDVWGTWYKGEDITQHLLLLEAERLR